MCRLLLVKARNEIDTVDYLRRFALMAKQSTEYQGDGWGCAFLKDGAWEHYKSIKPVWEDDLSNFGRSRLLIAHARSAFRNEGITVENNMPFYDDRHVFIFNGELHGVRIAEQGRIGAEKIFNFVKRFDHGSMLDALKRGVEIIRTRSRYVRAMNIIIAEADRAYVSSFFSEDPDYFTLHCSRDSDKTIVASQPLAGAELWEPMANGALEEVR